MLFVVRLLALTENQTTGGKHLIGADTCPHVHR